MNTPLTVYFSPDAGINEDGSRGPVWSSDAHCSAPTAKRMSEVLLETGWDGSTPLRFVGCDLEPCRLGEWYKIEHGKFPGPALARHQREAQIQKRLQDNPGGSDTGWMR